MDTRHGILFEPFPAGLLELIGQTFSKSDNENHHEDILDDFRSCYNSSS